MIVGGHIILKAEPRIVIGEPRFWGYVREDGKDEFIREFKNYENGCGVG